LAWTASTDAVGVTGYKIFRNGVQIGTSASANYSDTGLSATTAYAYTVSAYDAVSNESAKSVSASATTQTPAPVVTPAQTRGGGGGGSGTLNTTGSSVLSAYSGLLGGRSLSSLSDDELRQLILELTIIVLKLKIQLLQMQLGII
jgi:hypothetical protein